MPADDSVKAAADVKLLFTNGDTLSYASVEKGTSNYVYRFEMPAIAAKEMNDDFEFIFRYTYGGDIYAAQPKSVSLVNYYNLAVEKNAALVEVLNAMFNYGSAAQTYFEYDASNLANTNIPAEDRVDEYNEYTASQQDSTNSDYGEHYFEVDSYTYALDGKINLRLMFKKVDDTCDVSNLVFVATYRTIRGYTRETVINLSDADAYTVDGNFYTFDLHIPSPDLRQMVTAAIYTSDRASCVSNALNANFECYAYRIFNNTREANLELLQGAGMTASDDKITAFKNLCQATLNFSDVAAEYFIANDDSIPQS